MSDLKTYEYVGPVMIFNQCVADRWVGYTTAASKGRALSNLKYQFKKETNRIPSSKVDLPGKLSVVA